MDPFLTPKIVCAAGLKIKMAIVICYQLLYFSGFSVRVAAGRVSNPGPKRWPGPNHDLPWIGLSNN